MTDILSLQRKENHVIAITGNLGKSEVARLLGDGLSQDNLCYFSDNKKILPVRKNSQATISIHVVDFQADASSAALECDVCVMTSVTNSFESCANIFTGMKAGAVAIIAEAHDNSAKLAQQATLKGLRVIHVGLSSDIRARSDKDVWVERIVQQSDCSCVVAHILGGRLTYKISLPGDQAVINSLLALAAIKIVGGDMALAAISFASQKAKAGYGQEIKLGDKSNSLTLLDYSKGMNVLSLCAAIAHMSLVQAGKYNHRIVVLSDFDETIAMDKTHLEDLHKHLMLSGITRVLTTGSVIAKLTRSAGILSEEFASNKALVNRLQSMAKVNDVVVVMGTKSSGMAEIADRLKASYEMSDDSLRIAAE
jgi:UDP-N-acetylmuramoyl-tripeptide--D-alanyl-D-alanine ligase